MISQTSLYDTEEEASYRRIEPMLKMIVCFRNWLSADHLKLVERRQFYSVQFDSAVILRICNRPAPKISIASKSAEAKNGFVDYALPSLSHITDYADQIAAALQYELDRLPAEHSSCSRYEECRSVNRCTSPSDETAVKCSYRKKLREGTDKATE